LQWKTLQESNTDRFIVERSGDGIHYNSIGEVNAAGNSSVALQYQFTDNNLLKGLNYYRIKMMAKDGQFIYSPVRKITSLANDFTITMYPNPVTKGVVFISTSVNCNHITLTDVSGRTIKSIDTQGTQHTLNTGNIAKGTYFITVTTDIGKKVEKIEVE